jgi:hypothetical protein
MGVEGVVVIEVEVVVVVVVEVVEVVGGTFREHILHQHLSGKFN